MKKTQKLTFTAVCIALCIALPVVFHMIPEGGKIFSPMHIPVLLCGLVAGPAMGLISGLAGPLLSSLITAMPGPQNLFPMMAELAVYGLVSGLMMRVVRTDKLRSDLWASLLVAMIAGRVVGGIITAALYTKGTYSLTLWAAVYFGKSSPGIALHLLLVPAVYYALEKAKFIPKRYPSAKTERT